MAEDKNGRKFFKQIENTVEKEEISLLEQFSPFPQSSQNPYTADT